MMYPKAHVKVRAMSSFQFTADELSGSVRRFIVIPRLRRDESGKWAGYSD
jgi:hypothetical protein